MATPATHHDSVLRLLDGGTMTYIVAALAGVFEIDGLTGEYDAGEGYYYETLVLTGTNGDLLGARRGARVFPTFTYAAKLDRFTDVNEAVLRDVIEGVNTWAASKSARRDCRALHVEHTLRGKSRGITDSVERCEECIVTTYKVVPGPEGVMCTVQGQVLGAIRRS